MGEKKYLIYLDILGFDKLAKEIAGKSRVTPDGVRDDFIGVIKKKVEALETKREIIGKKYGESDDWLLVADNLDKVFTCIFEILDHKTKYQDYKKIPLEIAVGTAEFSKEANLQGPGLVIQDDVIKFLKTPVVHYYHKWYEQQNPGQSVSSTFIVFTEPAYLELEPLDKKICTQIIYKDVEFYLADLDKFQRRGRVFDFLEKINLPGSRLYHRIDDIFIPPLEFEVIKKTLEKKRIVFITGTPEYGKTYTAVRLMWEYYEKDYQPKWNRGTEREQRTEVRKSLEDIGAELTPKCIVYLEDPFGKTEYEGTEILERGIGTVLETIKQIDDAYVIITSREEVFKDFGNQQLSAEFRGFEEKINIKKPSYKRVQREKMLLTWAEEVNCAWFGNKELKEFVLDKISHEEFLPTPLSIKDFCIATSKIKREAELEEKIVEKSEPAEKAFAKEIECMTEDKIAFLLFPYISEYFEVDFVRTVYRELIGKLDFKKAPLEFDIVLKWFIDDKIKISKIKIDEHIYQVIQFSHPSYSKALGHLLSQNGYPSRINKEIFSRLLLKLSEKVQAARAVAYAVADNFNKLPHDIRNNLLLKLSEKVQAARAVALMVASNFAELPANVGQILFNLSENNRAARHVVYAVTHNLYTLPDDIRNKLLFKLSEKSQAAGSVALTVANNFDKLPDNVGRILFNLSEKDQVARAVAYAVADNFNKLPHDIRNNLLLKLSEKDQAAKAVAFMVANNFTELPANVGQILFNLSKKDQAAKAVADAVTHNLYTLPDDIRNRLLFNLSEKDQSAREVAWRVASNFNKLPHDIRNNLLLKLSEKDQAARAVALMVANNFAELPDDIRNKLLLKLSEKDQATEVVAKIVKEHFYVIPENVRVDLQQRLKDISKH